MTIQLNYPFNREELKKLKDRDQVLLSGTIFTARDKVHSYLYEGNPSPVDLTDQIIFHSGPIIKEIDGVKKVIAAGPTTSIRQELFMAKIIEEQKILGIIGKGGMGEQTQKSLDKFGGVYFYAVGGAAALYASKIVAVENNFLPEFGATESIWQLQVKDFPLIVSK